MLQCLPSNHTIISAVPKDMTGHRRFGKAVILQAIENKAALVFSSYSKQSFEFWCAVGGLDPEQVRKKAQQNE
jgi:hypothetical protein